MKFVALISGGKDLFFNIHHCISNGHELVALGNLYPAAEQDEIDLFMFQTVGHDLIDAYAECLGVPLYRQKITGGSSNTDLEYVRTDNDEVEDLHILLSRIQDAHPDVEGVSCGAILSHYQRTRVENVCDRLGLTSLAYLWQRNQEHLMREMIANDLDARLVKVAAIGLDASHLGKSIAEMLPTLLKLNRMYEVHVCGEGGEFETIVLDLPIFKKKLVMKDQRVVAHSLDVFYLKCAVDIVEKEYRPTTIDLMPLVDELFEQISVDEPKVQPSAPTKPYELEVHPFVHATSTKTYVGNLTASAKTLEEETQLVFDELATIVAAHGLTFASIQHVTLLLSNISEFEAVNRVYSAQFPGHLPPSRICIQTALSSAHRVQLSCTFIRGPKKGVHIRSRSYWAPQNIGPYSQAIVESHPTYATATLSGQIPLIPASMHLSPTQLGVLSLQHLYRVKDHVGVKSIAYVICFVTSELLVSYAHDIWTQYCEDIESESWNNRLVVVQVDDLPKHATIEWGGLSYTEVADMYEENEPPVLAGNVNEFEQFEEVAFGSMRVVVAGTNDPSKITKNKDNSLVMAQPHLLTGTEGDLIPVRQAWVGGTRYDYAVITRSEVN